MIGMNLNLLFMVLKYLMGFPESIRIEFISKLNRMEMNGNKAR